MFIQIRRNWKMLIFLSFFPMMMIRKAETTWPQEVKTIGGRSVQKKKNFCITESLPILQIFVRFSQREDRGSDFLFLGLQQNDPYKGVAGFTCDWYLISDTMWHMNLTSDTFSAIFLTKPICLVDLFFFYCRFMICDFFYKFLYALLFPR